MTTASRTLYLLYAVRVLHIRAGLVGLLLGGVLGASFGLRPALWAAALGRAADAMLLLATPVPRFRMPTGG